MTITIIGIGNMGGAIARGLCAGTLVAPGNIRVSDPDQSHLEAMKHFNPAVQTFSDNKAAVIDADIVLLAVKPWLVETVAEEIADSLDSQRQILISIAAGVEYISRPVNTFIVTSYRKMSTPKRERKKRGDGRWRIWKNGKIKKSGNAFSKHMDIPTSSF